ncbi:MAG: carbon-nitrogen hydrolase family protein [Pseudomonadota bacterium]
MLFLFKVFAAFSVLLIASCSTYRASKPTEANIEVEAETIRVALVQLDADNVGNWSVIASYIRQASQNGARIIVFPEASLFGWLNPEVFYDPQPIPNAATTMLAAYAETYNMAIVFGMAEQGPAAPGNDPSVHQAYDSAVLISASGDLLINSRKYQVLKNAFNPADCPDGLKNPTNGGCSYYQSPVSKIPVIDTMLGRTAVLVCADAYTWDTAALDHVKALGVETIFVVWGVAGPTTQSCGTDGFNATAYAADAARYTGATVIGANAVGPRPYGRFLPSVYCGYSGIVTGNGVTLGSVGLVAGASYFDVPRVKE